LGVAEHSDFDPSRIESAGGLTGSATSLSVQAGGTGNTSISLPNCSRRVLGASHDGVIGQPEHVFIFGHIGYAINK